MSEHTPDRQPSEEELRAGYTMLPGQKLTLDPAWRPGQKSTRYVYKTHGGTQIAGRPVAILLFRDGEHSAVEASVLDLGVRPGTFVEDINAGIAPNDYALLVASYETGTAVLEALERNKPWGVGRAYEGQEDLPAAIADQQCVVGLDDYGQLVIENLAPHGETIVQTF
jgi:hypothetical protein